MSERKERVKALEIALSLPYQWLLISKGVDSRFKEALSQFILEYQSPLLELGSRKSQSSMQAAEKTLHRKSRKQASP